MRCPRCGAEMKLYIYRSMNSGNEKEVMYRYWCPVCEYRYLLQHVRIIKRGDGIEIINDTEYEIGIKRFNLELRLRAEELARGVRT